MSINNLGWCPQFVLDFLSMDPNILLMYSYREFPAFLMALSLVILFISLKSGYNSSKINDKGVHNNRVKVGLSKEEVSCNLTELHKTRLLYNSKTIK
jgi:hypothetical protein